MRFNLIDWIDYLFYRINKFFKGQGQSYSHITATFIVSMIVSFLIFAITYHILILGIGLYNFWRTKLVRIIYGVLLYILFSFYFSIGKKDKKIDEKFKNIEEPLKSKLNVIFVVFMIVFSIIFVYCMLFD